MKASSRFMHAAAMLAVLLLSAAANGQNVLRRHYTMKKLLPCGTITAIEQAGRYVWFGGWALRPGEDHGLARYDKHENRWELFLESEGVIADEISTIAADGDRVWIGCMSDWPWNRGLHLYGPDDHSLTRHDRADPGLPHWRTRAVAVIDNEVWAATMGGVARLDKRTGTWMSFTQEAGKLSSNFTTCILADSRSVYVGTFAGLDVCNRTTGKWRNFTTENSILPTAVTDIDSDDTRIWLLAVPGVFTFDGRTGELAEWPIHHSAARQSTPNNIEITGDAIFIGSDAGLHMCDKRTGQWKTWTTRQGLLSNQVMTLSADDDYAWCVHEMGLGISRLDRRTGTWDYFRYREGCPSNHIYSLLSDGKSVYAGTFGSGLWKYEIDRDEWINLNRLLKNGDYRFSYRGEKSSIKFSDIRQMLLHDGRVWLATNHGLCVHTPGAEEDIEVVSQESFPMLCLAEHGGKLLCGGQKQGLRTYDPKAGTWDDTGKRLGLDRRIAAIQAGDDAAWLSDGERVYRIRENDAKPAAIPQAPAGGIKALLLDRGVLWVGTDHGLWAINAKNDSAAEIDKSKLPSPNVLSLSVARGRIWIGTDAGVAAFTPDRQNWLVFTRNDLLVDNNVSCVTSDSGYVWVGTLGGGMTRLAGIAAITQMAEEEGR